MAWHHEESRHERGYGYEWTKTRARILQRDMHLCQPCLKKGRATPAKEVDHITPRAQDGTDDFDNLQSICTDCHKAKTKAEAQSQTPRPQYDSKGYPIW